MYDKCYFCLDQLPKLKKESTASFFVNFGRSRGTKEPTYITVHNSCNKNTKTNKNNNQTHIEVGIPRKRALPCLATIALQ